MNEADPIVSCASCGTSLPRSEMFGVEPELQCPRCASGVRRRMQVRVRPLRRDRRPVVTLTVIGIAALLYVLDLAHPLVQFTDAEAWPGWYRQLWLALHPGPWIWDGEVWRLLSAAFFHGGFIHVLFNCWWILELGKAIESGFGRLTLALLVVGGAMAASAAEWIVNGPGVGLSGVVYALAFFLWAHHRTNAHAAAIMNRRTINFLSMWFVLCIVLTMSGTWSIANWAHGGGGLWGWGVGLALLHRRRKVLVPLAAALTIGLIALTPTLAIGKQVRARAQDQIVKAAGVTPFDRFRLDNVYRQGQRQR